MGYGVLTVRLLSLVLCLVAAPLAAADGPVVAGVEIRTDEPLAASLDLEGLLAFAPGDALDRDAVRRTLTNAFATGLFAEAEVLTRPVNDPANGDVVAILVLRGHLRVAEIEIVGPNPYFARTERRRVARLEGQILAEDDFEAGLEALREAWVERGWIDARVDAELLPRDQPNRVDLRVEIVPGRRPEVEAIHFIGDDLEATSVDRSELLGVLRTEIGEPWRPDRLEAERERLRRFWVERGHLRAEVGEPQSALRRGAAQVTFPVDPGPRVEVTVVGAPRFWSLRREEHFPFLGAEPFDEDLLRQSARRIEEDLQRRGHYLAEVRFERLAEERPGEEGIAEIGETERWRFVIDEGPELEVEKIRFHRLDEGRPAISDAELRRRMTTSEDRWLEPGSGTLVSTELDADLESLRSHYLLQGFPESRVGPADVVIGEESLRLVIPIVEGRRERVVSVELPGVRALDLDEVRRRLPLRPGGPFHPLRVEEAEDVLRALYEEEGYRTASVTPRLDWDDDHELVDVVLAVDEGPRTEIDRLLLRGLVRTRPEVVRRFADLESGEPLSRRRLLEAERDLYRLGVFSSVEVEPAPAGPTPPEDGVRRRDVLLRVEEGSRWRLSYGVSFHSDDGFGGLLGLTRNHVGGRAARLQLDLRASENDQRARLVYDDPYLGGRRFPLTWALFVRHEERESFSIDESGLQVALTRDFDRLHGGLHGGLRTGLVFDYRFVDTDGTAIDVAGLDRADREVEIASLTPNLFWDRRDDPLDPTRGGTTAVQVERAFPALSAESDFLKLFVQQTQHHPLDRFGVLAWSLRLGAIEPFEALPEPDPFLSPELANASVPPSERFFGGGRTTHRAFSRDRLGRLGETLVRLEDGRLVEAGGNGLLIANVDWRFPLAGNFGGVAWLDLGNVWADWRDVDPDQLRPGAGLGLRYLSPIGPVRLEVGWKLDTEPADGSDPVFFLSFGNPF